MEEADVDALLAIHLVTKHAEALSNLKASDQAVLVSVLVGELVGSLSPEPLFGPGVQHEVSLDHLVVALLQLADEVDQLRVLPLESGEVLLDTSRKSFPAHQKDQLFQQRGSLAVGDSIDQGLRHVRVGTLSLNIVIGC